jgi:hypothetical protein
VVASASKVSPTAESLSLSVDRPELADLCPARH